jgi:hypothetical protein
MLTFSFGPHFVKLVWPQKIRIPGTLQVTAFISTPQSKKKEQIIHSANAK